METNINCLTEELEFTTKLLKELKKFTDTLHNEILLLEGKDDDDKDSGSW